MAFLDRHHPIARYQAMDIHRTDNANGVVCNDPILNQIGEPSPKHGPLPESRAFAENAAKVSGILRIQVDEAARSHSRARQGGEQEATQKEIEQLDRQAEARRERIEESKTQLKHTEPEIKVGEPSRLGIAGWIGRGLLLLALVLLVGAENYAASMVLLSLGAFGVTSLHQAQMLMAIPIGFGVVFIFGYHALPPNLRRSVFKGAFVVLLTAFICWAMCFSMQTVQYRGEASQSLSLSNDAELNGSTMDSTGQLTSWLMFAAQVVSIALTTFIGKTGNDYYLRRFSNWKPNPQYQSILADLELYESEHNMIQNGLIQKHKRLATLRAEEDANANDAVGYYLLLKHKRSMVALLFAIHLLLGCSVPAVQKPVVREAYRPVAASAGPVNRVLAISKWLPPDYKKVARELVEHELAWLADAAPDNSETLIMDGLTCAPVARLRAVAGVSRVRKAELLKAMGAVRNFFEKSSSSAKDDGRVNLPLLAQTIKQLKLPPETQVVVMGNPLYLNDSKDEFFSMSTGRVPSDSCLFVDPKLNVYSIVGREKGLADQYWHMGWPDDSVFEDDTHRQAVLRFWSLYFQAQSARLVTAQASLEAAVVAARDGAVEPLMQAMPDPNVKPAMVRIVKVRRDTLIEIKPNQAERIDRRTELRRDVDSSKSTTQTWPPEQVLNTVQPEIGAGRVVNRGQATLDHHGNVLGEDKDLINDGEMAGRKLLLATLYNDDEVAASPLPKALQAKGFTVVQIAHPLPGLAQFKSQLDDARQLWLWSSAEPNRLPDAHRRLIVERWKTGALSLCLLADNDPFTTEVEQVLQEIIPGCSVDGDYEAGQTLSAQSTGLVGFDPRSPLFHNINKLFEGVTVSRVTGDGLVPVCLASNGSVLIATYQRAKSSRLVVHCGFTSFYQRYWDDAGICRFAANCAGWLGGIDAK